MAIPLSSHRRALTRAGIASTAVALAAAVLPASAAPAPPSPAEPGPVALGEERSFFPGGVVPQRVESRVPARRTYFVRLTGIGAAETTADLTGDAQRQAVREVRAEVAGRGASLLGTARTKDPDATQVFVVGNAVRGVGLVADEDAARAVAAQDGVAAVTPIIAKRPNDAGTAALTRALHTWQATGDLGRGATIGVVDTGLDYTHATFGGAGTVAAYDAARSAATSPTWRAGLPALARVKVLGGHDFAGDEYDADPAANPARPVPEGDPNPIDCLGHGTHVAGTAAGYGVSSAGATFDGDHRRITGAGLARMDLAPGTAPLAGIYALKVFGCRAGATDLVIPALDRALDPDGDGDLSDRLDVVNLSLGAAHGSPADPEVAMVDALARNGVLTVAAAGNDGDVTDAGSAPASAQSALSVASTRDAAQHRDGLRVAAPADVAGTAAGQASQAYDWAGRNPVAGRVVRLSEDNLDGCGPLSPADAEAVDGRVVWLEWDDDDTARRCGSAERAAHVAASGAVGAVLTNTLEVFDAGIEGDPDLPVLQLTRQDTRRLRPALEAGTLEVGFDGELADSVRQPNRALSDTVSTYSSRGGHGSAGSSVKPDVAAPGDTVQSAALGTGADGSTVSGSSSAAAQVAGIAALVRSARPTYDARQAKAAVMNTAGHDVRTGPGVPGVPRVPGTVLGPTRVGTGRVDARAAVASTLLAYSPRRSNRVSATFAPLTVPVTEDRVVRRRAVIVENLADRPATVSLAYRAAVSQPGVAMTVSPETLTVPAGSTRTVQVTMTVTPRELRRTLDPTMQQRHLGLPRQFVPESSGRLLVTPAGGQPLRVPVLGTARPASTTSATVRRSAPATGRLALSGHGVDQGHGRTGYRSLFSVLQLGAERPAPGLAFVGAGSDASYLWFGVVARRPRATPGGSRTAFVNYDVDGDRRADFETHVVDAPDGTTDLPTAVTVDIRRLVPRVVDAQPVNFSFGRVDTNVFDTDAMLLPVSREAIGLATSGSHPVRYSVGTVDDGAFPVVTQTPFLAYDAGDPDIVVDGPLFHDERGATVDYELAEGSRAQALLVRLHGMPGRRGQVLDLAGDDRAATPSR